MRQLGANTSADARGLSLSRTYASGTGWQRKSTAVEAPPNAQKAQVQVAINGIGEAWFDNLMFEGGTGRSGNILVYNPSFENDIDKSGLADGWYMPDLTTKGISTTANGPTAGTAFLETGTRRRPLGWT